MRRFGNIFYIFGVLLLIIGFIMYNYAISNDRQLIAAVVLIGVGVAFLLGSYV